jgi:hypothetical protein
MIFHCNEKIGRKQEAWSGSVKRITNHGSHYEIQIESRSGFLFMIGKYNYGAFISIPAFGVGCDLAGYDDYFWNNEQLSSRMNRVDAATVAEALRTMKLKNYI